MTPDTPVPTAVLVRRFAQGFAGRLVSEHGVGSPLGLWLLLATLAPASTGAPRAELEEILGTTADDAAARAAELLTSPHPAVGSALAVWARTEVLAESFGRWAATLTRAVETGPVPSQEGADAWARERTRGLVHHFPVDVSVDTLVVLASALVTKVMWTEPFDDATPDDLGGPFATRVSTVLSAPPGQPRFVAWTPAAGLVGVHVATSADGLHVVSVIAAPEVAAADVHAAAGEIAPLVVGHGPSRAREVPLVDLPLGPGHAWEVTRARERRSDVDPGTVVEVVDAVLPAWRATTDLDLAGTPGVTAAFAVLEQLLPPEASPGRFSARQVAVADYRKDGFDAAAVTGLAARAGAARVEEVEVRRATIRFNRPYAVLAVASDEGTAPEAPWTTVDLGRPAWDGVPVFSAWVASP